VQETRSDQGTTDGVSLPPRGVSIDLADISGKRINLLAYTTTPLYLAGIFCAQGTARIVLIVITVFLLVSTSLRKQQATRMREAPFTLASGVAIVTLWSWLIPEEPHMGATVLAAMMIYTALMTPRPLTEVGLGLTPAAYITAQIAFRGSDVAVPVLGVAATQLAIGILIFYVRCSAERRSPASRGRWQRPTNGFDGSTGRTR
jgi:hypothetical protein